MTASKPAATTSGYSIRDILSTAFIVIFVTLACRIMFLPTPPMSAPGHFAFRPMGIVTPPTTFAHLDSQKALVANLKAQFEDEKLECFQSFGHLCDTAPSHVCDSWATDGSKIAPKDVVALMRPNWNWLQAEALTEAYRVAYNVSSVQPLINSAKQFTGELKRLMDVAVKATPVPKEAVAKSAVGGKKVCASGQLGITAMPSYNELTAFRGAMYKLQFHQKSKHVSEDPYHLVTNAQIGTNKLCGVSVSGDQVFNPQFDVSDNFLLGKKEMKKTLKASNKNLLQTKSEGLKEAYSFTNDFGESAERQFLSKLSIWRPLSVHQPEKSTRVALRTMMRPPLLCITLTTYDGIEMSLAHHLMWGRNCDDHLIMALPVDGGDVKSPGASKRRTMPADIEKMANSVGMRPYKIIDLDPQQSLDPKEKYTRWQRLRAATVFLESWSFRSHFGYIYIADETVYAIPENIYALTMQPEIYYLNVMGAPLLLGNRMILPKEKVPYVAAAGGMLLNHGALELFSSLHNNAECHIESTSNADDVLLASCLSNFGIEAKDTTDELGQDRFHVMTPGWLLKTALHPDSSWWYKSYRPRSMDEMQENVFLALSSTSVSFGGINSIAKALRLHKTLWE